MELEETCMQPIMDSINASNKSFCLSSVPWKILFPIHVSFLVPDAKHYNWLASLPIDQKLCNPHLCLALQGGKEYLMRAHFGLPSVENEELEGRPPIAVRFEIPYFTVSGIQVSYA